MANKFIGCDISNNGIGITAPADVDMTFERTTIQNNGIGIQQHPNQTEIHFDRSRITIPGKWDPSDVKEMVEVLTRTRSPKAAAATTRIGRYLTERALDPIGTLANILTIASPFLPR